MAYDEAETRKYMAGVVAALIVIALAIGTFIFTVLKQGPEDLEPVLLDPSGAEFPTTPPTVPIPTAPPPSN